LDDDGQILAALIERARADDHRAVERIMVLCGPMVRGVACRYLVNRADVDDVVQEVWMRFAENLDRITSPASLRGWLVRVTARASWSIRGRDRRYRPLDTIQEQASDDDVEDQVVDRVHRSLVTTRMRAALDGLRPEDQQLLRLLTADERPNYEAVSQALHCPIGSIGPTRQRALQRLRNQREMIRLVESPIT
jgi:RNA polymerase sigma factor (sigma-70 family)